MILDRRVFVARMSPTSGDNDKESYVNLVPGGVRINIQPASAEMIAITEGAYGSSFVGYTNYSGIQSGDRLTVSGGSQDTYIVKGVRNWHFGLIPHLELSLFKGDA